MAPEVLVAATLAAVLVLYVLTGGADFGGGLWDLVASGPRRIEQRRAIANAIGPIWEANHVWVIVALVITFVAFPKAFSVISTALHVPLTLLLIGVVLRGTAFVFRAYAPRDEEVQRRFSWVFSSASTVTPVLLGMVVGAIASGRIRVVEGVVQTGFFEAWLAPFPFVVGLLTLAIFGFLAAVYLTIDTQESPALQEDFRVRGLAAAGAVFVLAWAAFFLARHGAPRVWQGLWTAPWSIPLQLSVAACGLGCISALYQRRFVLSRNLTVVQVALVVGGWALAQYPMVVPPDVSIADCAPENVLWTMLAVLAVGGAALVPAYIWLMVVFKGGRLQG